MEVHLRLHPSIELSTHKYNTPTNTHYPSFHGKMPQPLGLTITPSKPLLPETVPQHIPMQEIIKARWGPWSEFLHRALRTLGGWGNRCKTAAVKTWYSLSASPYAHLVQQMIPTPVRSMWSRRLTIPQRWRSSAGVVKNSRVTFVEPRTGEQDVIVEEPLRSRVKRPYLLFAPLPSM